MPRPTRRQFVRDLLAAGALGGAALARPARAAAERKPNIVLFYADDLDADELGSASGGAAPWPSYTAGAKTGTLSKGRAGRTGGYADPRMLTPHIDSIAAGGATLARFYVTSPVCTPSRYSLLMGRYASRSQGFLQKYPAGGPGPIGWDTSIDPAEDSLPKALQQTGYHTGVVGKWHNFPKGKGTKFDPVGILDHNPTLADLQAPGVADAMKKNYEMALTTLRQGHGWDFADRINIGNTVINLEWMMEGALNFIDQNHAAPFFLYVSLPVPHGQYTSGYCKLAELEPSATSSGLIDRLPDTMPSRDSVFERLKAAGIAPENAMATHMDDAVGVVLKKLDDLKLRDNTLVLFISDNGSRGKNSCYESAAHLPAFAAWPGRIPPGVRVESLCGSIDIAPTLIEAAGGAIPDQMRRDARSLLPQLLGQPEPADWRQALLLEIGNTKAAVARRWKYIANRPPDNVLKKMAADADDAAATGRPRKIFWTGFDHHSYGAEEDFPHYYDADQLYDLDADPYELKNLAANPAHAATQAEMKARLKELVSTLPHAFGEFSQ